MALNVCKLQLFSLYYSPSVSVCIVLCVFLLFIELVMLYILHNMYSIEELKVYF